CRAGAANLLAARPQRFAYTTLFRSEAGFECWHLPESRVAHLCGQSTGVTGSSSGGRRRPRYWFESRHRYFTKHHSRPYAALADAAWLFGTSVHSAARVLRRRPPDGPTHLGRVFVRYSLGCWSRCELHWAEH